MCVERITSRNDIDRGTADLHQCLSFDVRDQIDVHTLVERHAGMGEDGD